MISSVRDLLKARWGAPLSTAPRGVASVAVGVAPVTVLKQDAARVGFILENVGAGTVWVLPGLPELGPVSSTNGIRVEANGGNVTLNWEEDGEQVAWEWVAIASAPTTVLALPVAIDQGRQA